MQGLVNLVNEVVALYRCFENPFGLVDDWTEGAWSDFCDLANDAGLMIFG